MKNKTKIFKVSFNGRLKNASGIFYNINAKIEMPEGSTFEDINIKLYDNYEHITGLKISNL